VIENRVLRIIFVSKREEVTAGLRKILHEHPNLYSSFLRVSAVFERTLVVSHTEGVDLFKHSDE
jgi:hypothetical protein